MEPKRNYIKARASLMPLLVQSVALMLFSNITTAQTTTINTQTLATSGYSSATSAGSGGTAFITFCIYNNTGGNIKMTEVGRYVTTSHNGVESTIYYSSTSLSGAVGSLPATGWTQIHKDTIAGVSASAIAKVNDNVSFTIPNGATYRFALLIGGTNYYSSSGSPNSFTVNNISLYAGNYQISGSNVGYGATNTPRYFRGYVTFEPSCPASITTQPKDSTLCAGGNAGFGITATNVNTYQWQLSTNGGTSWNNISNGGAYSGATTNTLSVTGTTTAMNNYKYRCAATNTAGSCTVPSEAATLIVNAVPAITSTTADTACTGTPAQLAAVATAGATVQWYNQATGGTLLGTGNTLNIPSAPATNTNYYAFPNVTSVLSPDTLSVQMGATNSQTGCFMDIKALANIKLTDISWIPTATQSYDVSIYFKTGTAIGSETNSSSWTQIGSASSVSATSGVPIKTTLSTQPNLSANTTYAILVIRTGSSGSVRYQSVSAVGSVEAQNSDLQLISAKGISGLFTGSLFSPRQLACIVWYQKEVTPPCTATTRTPVQLVVDATPAIILHPKDSTICENGTGAFISAASNASSYQWEVSTDGGTNWNNVSNGSIYSGATTPSLIITGGTVAMSGYKYRCKASCTSSVTSNTATLTIITTPAITTNPLDATICDGSSTNFSCAATGAGQLSYQWQISTDGGTNWTNVIDGGIYSGSSTATLNITGATVSTSGYRFRCSVSGICAPDAMSNEAILTVNSLPAVTTSPASEADCPGTNVTFNCAATGTSTSYQWQEFTTTWSNLSNGGGYSGTSSNTLSISNISPAQDGRLYRCVISGACSPADTTDTASLTVYPTPNVSGTSNSPVCEEDNLQLTGASTTSGVTFSWTGPNGFSSSIQNPAIASPVVAHTGNFVVTTTVTATGCTAQATVPVVVKLKPSIPALTSNSAVCTNYDIELTASSTTGSTYSWTGPNNFNSNQQNPKRTKATNQMEGYYTAVATLNGCPSEPDSIFVDIVPSPAIGAYPSPGNKVCTGETITFFGISSNTGTNPVYQWLRNNVPIPGADSLKYISSGLIAGDVIKLRMTPGNDVSCNDDIFSVDIPVTVLPFLAPSVSISMDPPDNIWPGLLVTFTANTTDAGSKPQYQWKVNGQDVQGATGKTWATTTLDNNDIVTCDIVSDYDCPQPLSATSNAITVPLQVSVGNISGIKEISLYPNPNRGSFTIKGKVNGAKIKVEVINAVGQMLYNREIPLKDGNLDEEINAGNMTDGIYLLRLSTGEERSSIRFRVAN